jgi:Xaa-Pro aminopeptidase
MNMRQALILLVAIGATVSGPALAVEEGKGTVGQPTARKHARDKAMKPEEMDKHLHDMQEHMLRMHDLMHQIRDAKDPQEIQRLKQEQLAVMKAHMREMKKHQPGTVEGYMDEHRPEMPR